MLNCELTFLVAKRREPITNYDQGWLIAFIDVGDMVENGEIVRIGIAMLFTN